MLKPIDIHNTEFKRSFKGYNEEEVDNFLAKIVGKYETLYQENKELHQQIETLKNEIRKYQNKEEDIHGLITLTRETVAESKQIAAEHGQAIVDQAEATAKVIVEEAQWEARQLLKESEKQLEQTQIKIVKLSQQEQEFKEKMRQLMETFWAMLEDLGNQDELYPEDDVNTTKIYRQLATANEDDDS